MRIAICDDHLTFSEAMQTAWRKRGHQLAQASSPYEVGHFDGCDVVLLDLGFPGVEGSEAVEIVRKILPAVPLVVFTGRSDIGLIEQALESGADGAVLKQEPLDELESVLARVVTASASKGPRTPRTAVCSRQVRALGRPRRTRGPGGDLTGRESEVLDRLAAGWSTVQIAEMMGVQISTVRTHVQHLLTKFGVHSRLELVASARRTKAGGYGRLPQL